MSLLSNLNKLFSKPESTHNLGVAFSSKLLTYCYINDEQAVVFKSIPLSSTPEKQLSELASDSDIQGQCQLILSASQYHIVQIDKPNVPDDEIADALKWQVKDLVPYPAEDIIVDYFSGPTLIGATAKLNVVCASKNKLKTLVEGINQNNISLKHISTEEFAFASLLPVQDEACLLVCQQPNEEIILMIVKQGKLHFHRRLRGFIQINQESEQQLLMGTVERLSLEIQRSTDYFERQLKQAPIKKIKLILPIATEQFLADKLSENTHVQVSLLELPELYQDQRAFAVTIGALHLAKSIAKVLTKPQVTEMEVGNE